MLGTTQKVAHVVHHTIIKILLVTRIIKPLSPPKEGSKINNDILYLLVIFAILVNRHKHHELQKDQSTESGINVLISHNYEYLIEHLFVTLLLPFPPPPLLFNWGGPPSVKIMSPQQVIQHGGIREKGINLHFIREKVILLFYYIVRRNNQYTPARWNYHHQTHCRE